MAYRNYEYKYPKPVDVKLPDGSEFTVTVTYKAIQHQHLDPTHDYATIDSWVEFDFPNGLPERQKKLLDQYFLGQSYYPPLWVNQVLESKRRGNDSLGKYRLKPAQGYVPQSVPEAERPFIQITHDVAYNLPVPNNYETLWTNILNKPSNVSGLYVQASALAIMRDVFGIPVEQAMQMTPGELRPYQDAIFRYAQKAGNGFVLSPGVAEKLKTEVQKTIDSYNTSPKQPADSGTPSEHSRYVNLEDYISNPSPPSQPKPSNPSPPSQPKPSNPSPPSQPSEGSEGEGAFSTEAGQGNVSKIRFALDPATSTRISLAGRGIPFQGNIPLVNQAGSSAGFTYYNPNQNEAVNKYVDQLFANITKQATPQSGGASIISPLFGMSAKPIAPLFGMSAKPIAPLFNPSSSSEQNQTPESQSTQSTQQQNKSPIWNRYWDQYISKAADTLVPWMKGNQKSVFSW